MDYEKKYKEEVGRATQLWECGDITRENLEYIFPELKESEDEKVRKEIVRFIQMEVEDEIVGNKWLAWLEKQGSEPNWYHHKVDLSNCSEEYRKAYYDGWNNCNMQYSQCKSEGNDVVKCLINGMKFYYEDNEEATWGTEKFSMKVKDILSWLEKQGRQKPTWSEEDEKIITGIINDIQKRLEDYPLEQLAEIYFKEIKWLKSLRKRIEGE